MTATARSRLIRSTTAVLSSEAAAILIARELQRATEILEPIQPFFDNVDAGRVTESDCAIVAERRTGNDRDIRFAQQPVCEVLRAESELTDINQDVKGALRLNRGDVRYFCQSIDHVISAHVEF